MSTSIGSTGITFPDSTVQTSAGLAAGGTIATGTVTTLTTTTLNSTSGVLATQNGMTGICKAWVQFSGSTPTIVGSFNITSITKNGTGDFTANFTTAMPNTGYAVTGMSGSPASADTVCDFVAGSGTVTNTSGVRFGVRTLGGAYNDAAVICISVFSS
jgi:hypothetical protein